MKIVSPSRSLLLSLSIATLGVAVVPTALAGESARAPSTSAPTLALGGACRVDDGARPGSAPKATALQASPKIGAVGDTIELRATLSLADRTAVANETLRFRVAGKDVGAARTDARGVAALPFKVPNAVGPVPIEVTYAGSARCGAAKGSANLARIKASTKIDLTTAAAHRAGESAHVSGTLTRITDDAAVDGREIAIWYGGKQVSKVTTSSTKGSFSASVPLPKGAGANAKIEARFDGDPLYAPAADDVAFQVLPPKRRAELRWYGVQGKVGESATLVAELFEDNGPSQARRPIVGKKILFTIHRDGRWARPSMPATVLGEGVTAIDGRARVPIKLGERGILPSTPFGYTLLARVVDGADLEIESDTDTTLRIDASPVVVTMTAPSSAAIGQPSPIKVRVLRATDKAPIAGAWVALSPGGGGGKTGDDGEALFPFTPAGGTPTGPLSLTAKVTKSKIYEEGSASATVTITPKVN